MFQPSVDENMLNMFASYYFEKAFKEEIITSSCVLYEPRGILYRLHVKLIHGDISVCTSYELPADFSSMLLVSVLDRMRVLLADQYAEEIKKQLFRKEKSWK